MNRLSRREFLRGVTAAGALAALGGLSGCTTARTPAGAPAASGRRRPNIVFILSDDHGIDGVGCYGSDRFKGRTPNLDALAAGGIRFDQCYSTPLCGPTRCEILTGRYPFRTGGLTNGTAGQPVATNEHPMPRLLKQAGYATCCVGKWRQVGGTPSDWGFDEYITDPTAGGWFWQKKYTKNGKPVETPQEIYYPDVTHDFAMDFMRRNRDKPFFLYYSSHLVHGPILRTPDTKPGSNLYDDNVAYLDKQVGLVVAELDKLGLRENTVIVFSGDNGTAGRSGTIGGRQVNGAKGSMLEGGVRVPLIANWKGVAPAGRAMKDLIDFSDLLPTFCELGGAALPAGFTYDGRSFAPRLRGEKGNPRDWVFVQLGRRWYVREQGWKLTESGALFDMSEAPFEEKPVPDPQGAAREANARLQTILDDLNPGGGKTISETQVETERMRARQRRLRQNQTPDAAPPATRRRRP